MPKPDRRGARRAEAKALRAARPVVPADMSDATRLARFPPVAAWLSPWDDAGQLVLAGLARRRDDGDVALVITLVDLGCLGVKHHHLYAKVSLIEAERLVAEAVTYPVDRAEPELVSAVVRAAAAWSVDCGLPSYPSQLVALAFLHGVAAASVRVPLGQAGKPLLIPGPRDDADALMSILVDRFGLDGFHYVTPFD